MKQTITISYVKVLKGKRQFKIFT